MWFHRSEPVTADNFVRWCDVLRRDSAQLADEFMRYLPLVRAAEIGIPPAAEQPTPEVA